ncbi:hypothetical protein FHW36_105157 [Chitinophaga polysaccharea]|uniref:Uncharacterized protein n=1 Tax=Chitinophaga polysaccharea TaxID=1293035 RepID=A0A561PNQ4_9BACT|nr:MafI family immunity protein [Chitinophaga polysaccharea]TWF39718.1 hypothetical protein FHW36_105157 [Chitinophaga polysaccharea]
MNKIEKLTLALIDAAGALGLSKVDLDNATILSNSHEYGLAFDTIVTQLYEYDTDIDIEFYNLVVDVAQKMRIPENTYSFIRELIRDKNVVPKSVKDKLAEILHLLEDGF